MVPGEVEINGLTPYLYVSYFNDGMLEQILDFESLNVSYQNKWLTRWGRVTHIYASVN